MKVSIKLILASIVITSLASCAKDPVYNSQEQGKNSLLATASEKTLDDGSRIEVVVIKASGNIEPALNEFRELLGKLNTAPGAVGGRREINWDGVPDAFTNNNLFPGDFFGAVDPILPNGRKRGLINTTPGDGFSISDSNFTFINPSYAGQFSAFSPAKTFIAAGSNITDNFFKVPGTDIDATVQGFGVVFSDVNNASSTYLEFFDGNISLGTYKVPNNGNNNPGGFSFLGVYFPNKKATQVRIKCGSAALSSTRNDIADGDSKDLVTMDDFIYSEPQQ